MIRLSNVSKYYHSANSVCCALRKINLEFKKGEFVAITGESGSGKTTLLNIISGLDSYEEGEIFVNGLPTSYFDQSDWEEFRKKEIAFIFQHYNLIDSFNCLENVIASLLIEGSTYKEAKKRAYELLDLVGLKNHAKKRAAKLSGGQKQRLAIARALAKDTDIIVADEPTGNLDALNGKMIMELLKRISKDKLVLIVTHNYLEAQPYITRKIRLHDGEVIQDEEIGKKSIIDDVPSEKIIKKDTFSRSLCFSFLNIKAQPKKTLLVFLLIFISSLASFVFIGTFAGNIDDAKTKNLDSSLFINHDNTRLLVRTKDSRVLKDEDYNKAKVKHAISIEKYDYISDVNYFRPNDYKFVHSGGVNQDNISVPPVLIDSSCYVMTNHKNYMRSSSFLDEGSLSCGRLPISGLEMVIYSNDKSILGTEELIFFNNSRLWGSDTFISYKVKIVGLLKDPTTQAYFSPDIAKVIDFSKNNCSLTLSFQTTMVNSSGFTVTISNTLAYKDIIIDFNLDDNEISFCKNITNSLSNNSSLVLTNGDFLGFATIKYQGINIFKRDVKISLSKSHSSTDNFIAISPNLFFELYCNNIVENDLDNFNNASNKRKSSFEDKTQFGLFIDDYAYTDDVINMLLDNDLVAISAFRASVVDYNIDAVISRYITLGISIVGLFLINFVLIVLCKSILKFKKNDYLIFKMIGMSNKTSREINYIELYFYAFISFILIIVVSNFTKHFIQNDYLVEFFKYIRYYHYILSFAISFIVISLLGHSFNKYLRKRIKVTSLKED